MLIVFRPCRESEIFLQSRSRELIFRPSPFTMASEAESSTHLAIDPFDLLQVKLNPDGTLSRDRIMSLPGVRVHFITPNVTADAAAHPDNPAGPNNTSVLSKDVPLNPSLKTWVRIFLPHQARPQPHQKLPLVVYYHGGGFILCSAGSAMFHDFCSSLSLQLPAMVVSVAYRLAPEHRLPAAYEDALEALCWIGTARDEWIESHADLSTCYLMGCSAGGNIAYRVGLQVASAQKQNEVVRLGRMKIRGLILHHPFFGGSRRTASELRLANDPVLPQSVSDLMWELSLPIGADRDHRYCNPISDDSEGDGSELRDATENMKSLGWRVLIIGSGCDLMIDRQIEVVKWLEAKGVCVVSDFREGGHHAIEVTEPDKSDILMETLKDFISKPKVSY